MTDSALPMVSVVLTAHDEGRLAHASLRSVWRAVAVAEQAGIRCEVVAILDRPSPSTRAYFARNQDQLNVYEVDFGDTGPSRNEGAARATGKYVSYLDADDLYDSNWLRLAFENAEAFRIPCVLNPRHSIVFGAEQFVVHHVGTDEPEYFPENLVAHNPWVPAAFTLRSVVRQVPFQPTPRASGFGYEDWHWYCSLRSANIPIRIVEDTAWFYRRRPGTRYLQQRADHAMTPPAPIFEPRRFVSSCRAPIAPLPPVDAPPHAAGKGDSRAATTKPPGPESDFRRMVSSRALAVARKWLPGRVRYGMRLLVSNPISPHELPGRTPATEPPPAAVLQAWRNLHDVEPALFPRTDTLPQIPRIFHGQTKPRPFPRAYATLCAAVPDEVTHVVLVPWLRTGGADLCALAFTRALVELDEAARVLVIGTRPEVSTWAHKLPPRSFWLPFGAVAAPLKVAETKLLLARLLAQLAPRPIVNIHSRLGYDVYVDHGRMLSQLTHLYAHVFCDHRSREGQWSGYSRGHIPRCFDFLTRVTADNQAELDMLQSTFALDAARLQVLYNAVDFPAPKRRNRVRQRTDPLEVLWAGRLDDQKRPDLLQEIARRCSGLPIRFSVYGKSVLGDSAWAIRNTPNLTYHGPYDGFATLPTEQFDAFLYTSSFDGLPNVVLEAMAHGLPVVASDVGGVAEAVRHNETGLLVTPFDDVEGYVGALKRLLDGAVDIEAMRRNAEELLYRRHTVEHFRANIARLFALEAGATR